MSKNFLTSKQVCTILQIEPSTLRFWEKEFAEFLDDSVQTGQRKRFDQTKLEIFSQIKELLYTEHYTIKGAKRRLEMDKCLEGSLGIEGNFKNTVICMLSSIISELQKAREESKQLLHQVELLQAEKRNVELRLEEEQNKSIFTFLAHKIKKTKDSDTQNHSEQEPLEINP